MLTSNGIVALMTLLAAGGDSTPPGVWTAEAGRFELGPVPPTIDLRNMLTRHIVQRSCEALDATAERRREALASGEWEAWREGVRKAVAEGLGDMPFGDTGGPLNVRAVSRHERPGYILENVLFESLPGLDVNGSVYLPLASEYPPPWPAIVVPVGHSAKTKESYQIPAQVFARMGYVAITFDPPGMAGEKRPGNDHFGDGVRCYLTGCSSNRYFIIDALRCIDYLATRADVDLSKGVGMTGVSGGGMTTMYATLLDDRIAVSGPSCCAVPNALHPVLDAYAPCPETLALGRFAAYDDVDLLAAAMPTPVLLMAGAGDEVFTESMSRAIATQVGDSFAAGGLAKKFGFFLDPGGHAYTVAMAVEFVNRMDTWVRETPGRELPGVSRDDFEMLPDATLACHPRTERSILTVNRDVAIALRDNRSGLPIQETARKVAGVNGDIPVPEARAGEPALAWFHHLQELMLSPEDGIELPATFMYPAKDGWKGGALLYFDDRGRWTDLRTQGFLTRVSGFIQKDTDGPAVLTVDLRGWGDSRPGDVRYDLAGWGSRAQWISYLSAGLGDHVMAMRIRDGLSALSYLRSREEVDATRIVVGGRGMGGVVALHVAAIDGQVAGVFSADALATFESLAVSESYAWPHDAFLPDVLRHYDLPGLCAGLAVPALVVNPLDAGRASLTEEACAKAYKAAIEAGAGFTWHAGANDGAALEFIRASVRR
jgi:cephalosporin-C deacetylase-like acetyl esterase